ncbi:LuxR C-terminal-related transcriptional regulator [Myroides sp. WP-1]|uniref:LuxR C-terminal-related transcriptional regulator n=1 Tax=Myroides sp. WP-1 TaxID=2759944 RepID=UPI0015FDB794|nr:LuxR C-terminal-related transcriptional regulator [Myroides sp. WP-1]MBB1138369.1 hypothetical protein [Myroides sp. WP-1]
MNTLSYKDWVSFLNQENVKMNTKGQNSSLESRTSYYFIFDTAENNIPFISSAFALITGHQMSSVTSEMFISWMHPNDRSYFFEKELQGQEFTNKLRNEELFRYVFKYSYRLRKADGSYILVLQEYQALEINEEGYWCKSLVTHKVMDTIVPICSETDYKIYDKELGVYLDLTNRFNLTTREQEIVQLIKEGLTSKQVSDLLHLSVNTVLTHRKNILSKTNSTSFIGLLKKLEAVQKS